jgi:hypothetical protein
VERDQLEGWLNQGLWLEQIGNRTGKHASTVGYWCKKLGLAPNGRRSTLRGAAYPKTDSGTRSSEAGR